MNGGYCEVSSLRGGRALEQTAQRCGGISIPGTVQKAYGCGTWGYVLMVNTAVLA